MPLNYEEIKILEDNGWEMVCESPLEFELHAQFAGGIHKLYSEEEQREELQRIRAAVILTQHMEKPKKVDWDTYFIAQCFLISMRSPDTTKHGAIIVDKDNRVLSQGYNGPVGGIDDSKVPMTRPEKYPFMIHAEENAILSLNGPVPEGSKIYVTGRPCHKCTRMILRKEIKTIIYGPQGSNCVDTEDITASYFMIKQKNAKLIEYTDLSKLKQFMLDYTNRIGELL